MLEFVMSRAQWNAVRRNDIDLIGIDAARAQLKPARDVPPTDKQGVLLLNKRDTRLVEEWMVLCGDNPTGNNHDVGSSDFF